MTPEQRDQIGERLSAYLDGELSAEERAQVETLLRENAEARAILDELQAVVTAVRSLPREPAPSEILDEVSAALERDELLGPSDENVRLKRHGRPIFSLLPLAAAFVILVGGGLWFAVQMSGRSVTPEPRLAMAPPKSAERRAAPALDAFGKGNKKTEPKVERVPSAARDVRGADGFGGGGHAQPDAETREGVSPSVTDEKRAGDDQLALGLLHAPSPVESKDATPSEAPAVAADTVRKSRARGNYGRAGATVLRVPEPADSQTLEQKLAQGAGVDALASHQFANEPLRLAVRFPDDRELEIFDQRLDASLNRRGFVAVRSGGESRPALTSRVFVRGQAQRNYQPAGTHERQVLLRLPAEEVGDLVAELDQNPPEPSDVQLSVGGLTAEGRKNVIALAQRTTGQPLQGPQRIARDESIRRATSQRAEPEASSREEKPQDMTIAKLLDRLAKESDKSSQQETAGSSPVPQRRAASQPVESTFESKTASTGGMPADKEVVGTPAPGSAEAGTSGVPLTGYGYYFEPPFEKMTATAPAQDYVTLVIQMSADD